LPRSPGPFRVRDARGSRPRPGRQPLGRGNCRLPRHGPPGRRHRAGDPAGASTRRLRHPRLAGGDPGLTVRAREPDGPGRAVAVREDKSFRTERALVEGLNTLLLRPPTRRGTWASSHSRSRSTRSSPRASSTSWFRSRERGRRDSVRRSAGQCSRARARSARTGAESSLGGDLHAPVLADGSFSGVAPALPGEVVELRAVDLAGNESAPAVRIATGADPAVSAPDPSRSAPSGEARSAASTRSSGPDPRRCSTGWPPERSTARGSRFSGGGSSTLRERRSPACGSARPRTRRPASRSAAPTAGSTSRSPVAER